MKSTYFKNALRRVKGKQNLRSLDLPLFAIKYEKLEPIYNKEFLTYYLSHDTDILRKELKKPENQDFILNELKTKRILDKLYTNVEDIVEKTIGSWKTAGRGAYVEIYSRVSQEICKFNNDLNQISCNLSDKYVGHVNLAVVYIIWKLIINQKIREQQERYEAKKCSYESEWKAFKARASRNED